MTGDDGRRFCTTAEQDAVDRGFGIAATCNSSPRAGRLADFPCAARVGAPTVLIGDSHPLFAEGVKQTLEPAFEVCGVTADGQGAVRLAGRWQPAVAILDCLMPNLAGNLLVRAVRAVASETRILLIDEGVSGRSRTGLIREGVYGSLPRTVGRKCLLDAVREVSQGGMHFEGQSESLVMDRLPFNTLTKRLRQVLALVGAGMTAGEVGERLGISERTAEHHRAELRARLKVGNKADLFRIALEFKDSELAIEALECPDPTTP